MTATAHKFSITLLALTLLLGGCGTMPRTTDQTSQTAGVPVVPENIDVLFLAYDYSAGHAFRKLLPTLTEKGISWHVLAFGPAGTLFPDYQNATDLNSRLTTAMREQLHENRFTKLPLDLRQQTVARFYPRIVISGLASLGQLQLVRNFWEQGAWTIGFYDHLEPPQGQQWLEPWLEQNYPVTEELLVPDAHLSQAFPSNFTYRNSVIPVQHPVLSDWKQAFSSADKTQLRQQLRLDQRPIVVVAGDDGQDYQHSRALIANAARLRSDLQWLFAPHPRTISASQSEHFSGDDPLRTVLDVPAVQLATVADLFVTHRAISGWMAAQMGVPALFVQPESDGQKHAINRAQTVNSLASTLNEVHRVVDNPSQDEPLEPEYPHMRMVDIIEERLQTKQPKLPKVEMLLEEG